MAARELRRELFGRPDRADMMNLLAQFLETVLRQGQWPVIVEPPPADIAEDLYLRGVAALAGGRLDAADGAFRAALAVDPPDYASRVALAVIVILATNTDGIRLVLAEAGAVDVRRSDGILHIAPAGRPIRGRALFAYYSEAILLPAGHPSLAAHTNRWESRCIARLLVGLGYAVDAIWFGGPFPSRFDVYDVVFCLHDGLARMAGRLSPAARKIMLLTGSSADYQNRREHERLAALAARRGIACKPRRQIEQADRELEALALADHCLLQGNAHTQSTYAASLQAKTLVVPVTGAAEACVSTSPGAHVAPRHVLWHFGIGAIHKGLDLAVEVFLRNPGWTLEVVSQACGESDFLAIYGEPIRKAGNIRLHGFQFPSSRQFREIVQRCVVFLGTSCSEGTSTACITSLQHGLVPVVTRDCGLDLEPGFGVMIEEESVESIERALAQVLGLPSDELARQGRLARARSERRHSRKAFADAMGRVLERLLIRA